MNFVEPKNIKCIEYHLECCKDISCVGLKNSKPSISEAAAASETIRNKVQINLRGDMRKLDTFLLKSIYSNMTFIKKQAYYSNSRYFCTTLGMSENSLGKIDIDSFKKGGASSEDFINAPQAVEKAFERVEEVVIEEVILSEVLLKQGFKTSTIKPMRDINAFIECEIEEVDDAPDSSTRALSPLAKYLGFGAVSLFIPDLGLAPGLADPDPDTDPDTDPDPDPDPDPDDDDDYADTYKNRMLDNLFKLYGCLYFLYFRAEIRFVCRHLFSYFFDSNIWLLNYLLFFIVLQLLLQVLEEEEEDEDDDPFIMFRTYNKNLYTIPELEEVAMPLIRATDYLFIFMQDLKLN